MDKGLKRSEFLFFVAYILWLVLAVIKLTYLKELMPYKQINEYAEKIIIGLLFLKLVDDSFYKLREIIGVVCVALLYYMSMQADASAIMIPIYFIFSARNIDYKCILKISLWIEFIIMSISVSLSVIGIIPNEIWDADTRARYSLGYTFCTYGSHIFLFITLMYLSIRSEIFLWELAVLLATNYMWFMVTNTRIDLLLCVPAVLLVYILNKLKIEIKYTWMTKLFFGVMGPVIAIVSVAGHWFYDESVMWMVKVNQLLNGRLWYGWLAFKSYSVTLWGQNIKWVGRGGIKKNPNLTYNYVDSSYVKYLLNYGVIFFILLLVGIVIAGQYVRKTKNKGLAVAYLVWIIYGAIDAELFELAFQPFMLLLAQAFCVRPNESVEGRRFLWEKSIQ